MRCPPAAALPLLLALAVPLAPHRAAAQAESREGIYLQNQILQLRQELDQLRRGGAVAPVPIAPARPAGPQGEVVGSLLERVQRLEEDARTLRGRLEESEFRNRQLSDRVEKLQGDLDFRLQQIEGQGGGAAARPAAPAAAAPPARPAPPP
ncbi:hypothetical protein JYK14_28280, partial [Siccirubricoccus sp. KC 17139]